MQRVVVLLLVAALGWFGYTKYEARVQTTRASDVRPSTPQSGQNPPARANPVASPIFKCDGRTRCSQMASCDEAKYFLKNCPGTKMDGDGNGIPCERQWCNK